eukprot:CAMPEP_0181329704 /NCGR_PEP_ID=MMETSP1101-20121128/23464_1 /TAXON_ID=46948 /ORGANISM="Rhodomonas abbreviata, Strain Caron Lab Isolate" /LENGTH=66 /DNA_ID=CAMNT_0023438823 /DNA_START=171 /DNA_END=371 /DNA_ORIENTATION=-
MVKLIAESAVKGYAQAQICHLIDGVIPGVGTTLASLGPVLGAIIALCDKQNQDQAIALIETYFVDT